MREKLEIGEAISDAVQHIRMSWKLLLINYLFMLGIGLITTAYTVSVFTGDIEALLYTGYKSPFELMIKSFLMILPFMIVIGLISVCIQAMYIKIIDDTIEKRQLSYKEQFVFVLRKLGKMIFAGVMVLIPVILMYLLMFRTITNMYYGSFAPFFLMLLIMLAYAMMLTFINQSIITEEVSAFQAIKNSFSVVSHNFFRLLFTFIGYGILTLIIGTILKDTSVVVVVIKAIIDAFLSLYAIVFITTLYKQVSKKPYQDNECELEYYEEN
ncbi:MAG: hypothetical protein JEZ08_22690 [Clostridiales bacterium]|nr:hypothetical protein [Clostridiales bacterium]